MVKLTMRWIMFPFGHEEIFFLSLFLHGRSDCHFIAVNLNGPLPLFMSCPAGEKVSGDIYKRRHGTGCAAPTCFHRVGIQSLSLGEWPWS